MKKTLDATALVAAELHGMLGVSQFVIHRSHYAVAAAGASSGFFVRHARSASLEELASFILSWGKGGVV